MSRANAVGPRDLLTYLRGETRALVVVGVLALFAAAGLLLQPILVRSLLDAVSVGRPILRLAGGLVVLLLAVTAANGLHDYLLQRAAEGVMLRTRRRLVAHILRLSIAEYDQRSTGDLLSRVSADTALFRQVLTAGLFDIVAGVVMVIGATVAMVVVDPVLFAVTCGSLTVGLASAVMVAQRMRPASERVQAELGTLTSLLERGISAARTIRAARAEARESEVLNRSAQRAFVAGVRLAKLQAVVGPAAETATQTAFVLVLGVGGARVASGTITVADLVTFVLFLFFLLMPLGRALSSYAQLQTGLGALQRIHEILLLPVESSDSGRGAPARAVPPRPLPPGVAAVSFDRVTFGYDGGDPVVSEVTFSVPCLSG